MPRCGGTAAGGRRERFAGRPASDCLDHDAFGIARQRSEILAIAGQHASPRFGSGHNDGVDGRAALCSEAQLRSAPSDRFGELGDNVTRLQHSVGVRIRPRTTRHRLDHDKRHNDGRPEPFSAKHGYRRRVLSIASSEPCDGTTVDDEHRSAGSRRRVALELARDCFGSRDLVGCGFADLLDQLIEIHVGLVDQCLAAQLGADSLLEQLRSG